MSLVSHLVLGSLETEIYLILKQYPLAEQLEVALEREATCRERIK